MKQNSSCNRSLLKNKNIQFFLFFFILFNLLIVESFSKINRRNKFSKTDTNTKFTINNYDKPVPSSWDDYLAVSYRDMAGLGYLDKKNAEEQLSEIKKGDKGDKKKISAIFRFLFQEQGWEHIGTYTGDKNIFNYSFTIIRNIKKGKVIVSFSGTKSTDELMGQITKAGGETYFRDNYSKRNLIYIMKYFHNLYKEIFNPLKELIEKAKDKLITQYIFTGHSLGGAMASLSVFDLTINSIIPKTNISPVLITYGQPRVGNYAFANEIMKTIPIIFRIENKTDCVASIPLCMPDKIKKTCKNEFSKDDLDPKLENYQVTENIEKNFHPWHFGGLILIKEGQNPKKCEKSESIDDDCKITPNCFAFDSHTIYFGNKISEIIYNDNDLELKRIELKKKESEKSFLGSIKSIFNK